VSPAVRSVVRWIAGIAIASGSLWFMASQLSVSAAQLGAGVAQVPAVALLAASGLFAGSVLAETVTWYRVLRGVSPQSRHLPRADAFAVFNVSAIGKYLPGKIWGYAWQIYLLGRRGVPAYASLQANGIALVAACAAGTLVGGAGALAGGIGWMPTTAAFAVAVALLALVPLQHRVGILSRLGKRLQLDRSLFALGTQAWIEAVGGYCVVWLVYGAGGIVLARVLHPALNATTAAAVVAAMCLSWLIGTVVFIAPAGLGVREAVMALALSHLPGKLGFVLPIATRLLLIAVDLTLEAAALGILWYRRSESKAAGV